MLWLMACVCAFAQDGEGQKWTARRKDSVYVANTGDSIRVPFYRLFSFHTNAVDWALATPNVTLEVDLSRRQKARYSLLFTGKWNPATKNHTISPRWVYNVSTVKGELRRYWRTGNAEDASDIPAIKRDTTFWHQIALDTTLWKPWSKLSYLRRRYLSSRYVQHPRSWRAYYLGIYAASNRFSLCLDGDGKQGNSYSVGLSAGWSVPLYKHLDGSGWDLDLGISGGLMMTAYDEYRYERESGCYVFTQSKERFNHPMVQDVHISLVYRLRTIEKKALYGATRFAMREERRQAREQVRWDKKQEEIAHVDTVINYGPINNALAQSKEQLALYTDTTAYYYEVLKAAIQYTEYDKANSDLINDPDRRFKRDVMLRYLEYYMHLTNEMAPESQRTDRAEREAQRKKAELQRLKDEKREAKEAERQARLDAKQAKAEAKQAEKQAEEVPADTPAEQEEQTEAKQAEKQEEEAPADTPAVQEEQTEAKQEGGDGQ